MTAPKNPQDLTFDIREFGRRLGEWHDGQGDPIYAVGSYARIGEAKWNESDNKDYGNRYGVSYGQIFGMRKSIFNSIPDGLTLEDFGVMSLYSAAA